MKNVNEMSPVLVIPFSFECKTKENISLCDFIVCASLSLSAAQKTIATLSNVDVAKLLNFRSVSFPFMCRFCRSLAIRLFWHFSFDECLLVANESQDENTQMQSIFVSFCFVTFCSMLHTHTHSLMRVRKHTHTHAHHSSDFSQISRAKIIKINNNNKRCSFIYY